MDLKVAIILFMSWISMVVGLKVIGKLWCHFCKGTGSRLIKYSYVLDYSIPKEGMLEFFEYKVLTFFFLDINS